MKKIYLKIKFGRGKSAKGYILDISRGGIGIASSRKILKGTAIELIPETNIFLPLQGKIVSISDRKRKSYRYRLGAKFILAQKQEKTKLRDFIQKIEKRKVGRLPVI